MKPIALSAALLLAAAGVVFLQTSPPPQNPAALMPGGALLYLEAPDFGRLLRDWDASQVKADWLGSANYAVFSRSNLFAKLAEVYDQYGAAAGFTPGLKNAIEIAGTESALALYEFRNVEFLYISRIADADLMNSRLWAVREKFEQRQAGGQSFYLRTDPESNRTVAFAFVKGRLLLSTRDDLIAQALELMAGGGNPSIASDRWYRDAAAAARAPGELRLALNLDSLTRSVYFRSYWIQRNVPAVRQYWAGIADLRRTESEITESRVFLRVPSAVQPATATSGGVSRLLALVPPQAGLYKASRIADSSETAALIVDKLIGAQPETARDWREAPLAAAPDQNAGSEADLETRIDEQPLPAGPSVSDSVAALRALLEQSGAHSLLLLQSSALSAAPFVRMPSAFVLESPREWDRNLVRDSLAAAAGKLWTTAQLGAGWVSSGAGPDTVERLDGLGALALAIRGTLLFLSNDSALLASVLNRAPAITAPGSLTYAAGFRHSRERANYERMMAALDFTSPANAFGFTASGGSPNFFSGNIESLSRVLSGVAEIRVTQEESPEIVRQMVVYRLSGNR